MDVQQKFQGLIFSGYDGFGDCDTDPLTGCETTISSNLTHCGSCGRTCEGMLNVEQPICVAGQCSFLSCKPGFGNCDSNDDNGCECTSDELQAALNASQNAPSIVGGSVGSEIQLHQSSHLKSEGQRSSLVSTPMTSPV